VCEDPGRPPESADGLTQYERELFGRIYEAWDPKNYVVMYSVQTEPLSAKCKDALVRLGAMAGLTVEFTVEDAWGAPRRTQHFVRALRENAKQK
jgi:hypothetical protein